MKKTAEAAYPLHDLIAERWSPRAFSDQPVSQEQLGSLLEAARWAASCYNEQPWRFMVATKDEPAAYQVMLDLLMEGNQGWAQNAYVLMIGVAKKTLSQNGKPNGFARYDLGQAAATMTLQAEAMGLSVHQMGGFFAAKAEEVYGIPEDYEAVSAIALGYAAEPETLSDEAQEREKAPRARRDLADIAFTGTWEQKLF